MSKSVRVGNITIDPKDGYIFDTIATSSVADSAAETLDIKGLDLSSWDDGRGYVNWEHASDGPSKSVGAILYSKKIYKESDCDNERERLYWERAGEHPYVYAVCQLFDKANHPEAIALAAIMRAQTKNGPTHKIGTSIEGATVARDEKDPSILRESIGKGLAVTVKPANKVCHVGTLADDGAPEGYKLEEKKDLLAEFADSKKSENPLSLFSVELAPDSQEEVLSGLNKTISLGGSNSAPSELTGGAALQREDISSSFKKAILKAVSEWGDKEFNKAEFKTFMKSKLPDVSDSFLDHFVDAVDNYHFKNKVIKSEVNPLELKLKLDLLDINLRKAVEELRQPPPSSFNIPLVYKMAVRVGNEFHPAGRYMFYNNQLTHLEDYHGLLGTLLPEGPLNEATVSRIDGLSRVGDIKIEGHPFDPNGGTIQPEVSTEPEAQEIASRPIQPSVFLYQRVGMDRPHTLEFHGEEVLLDGNKLEPAEIATIKSNLDNNVATIRYKNDISKMEVYLQDLIKDEEAHMDPDEALQSVRAAVKAGHVHPSVERALTKHLYQDSMSPLGNKYAFQKFMEKNKPGTYLSLDLNDFRHVNTAFGHGVGDEAIKAYGNAIHGAIQDTMDPGQSKSFRPGENTDFQGFRSGGDEAVLHMPSHEHAANFARAFNKRLDALPPINGAHKLSASIGIGHNYETADKALYEAKKQKVTPSGDRAFPIGQVPNLAHSLHPDSSGPIPLHDPKAATVHANLSQPKMPDTITPEQPKAA